MNRSALRIAINGALGKMSSATIMEAMKRADFALVDAMEKPQSPFIGKDIGLILGVGEVGVKVSESPICSPGAEVVIDFSLPGACMQCARQAASDKRPFISGTTGLSNDDLMELQVLAEQVPIVYAPNMSLGINLLSGLISYITASLGDAYDVEIVERHHRHKLDAPSGTALMLAGRIASARGLSSDDVLKFGREKGKSPRKKDEIAVHAIRAGDIFGEHEIIFAGEKEELVCIHRAMGRETFAKGALRAAKFIVDKQPGFYSMLDVLGFGEID